MVRLVLCIGNRACWRARQESPEEIARLMSRSPASVYKMGNPLRRALKSVRWVAEAKDQALIRPIDSGEIARLSLAPAPF